MKVRVKVEVELEIDLPSGVSNHQQIDTWLDNCLVDEVITTGSMFLSGKPTGTVTHWVEVTDKF